ncbi:MAG: hypothetical protein A3I44_06000 [Candidatus Sungbacteria bacterium RIFCSPLOWO2_02_FULL_51_17]|uniref:Uncharacterized protein n=1 Tax=Candidatus Sungbacteria bacterium RIFCSPHIGHO2_02_FULL_51_29 TaxID=1802273 RepID=A0A1G2KRH5_9BACT|nr:MAG: hypothetical protein A3C16_03260 [Candidatus Sungbacteria bacterium RIFCSPHIGHO2_02_FULL_51_29]OHA07503.1 MAG: hypothetical protein A3B29_02315 [Candidatus Sungbacteria bacterium RIFCSPLOWO2_01_FULL_51_34]OHA12402.1 MAG: hypothetical protein A3I44_06000 [Candidatus Sungbacteria bacterium RIFCSPLOWO2_02_FULL_51_17]
MPEGEEKSCFSPYPRATLPEPPPASWKFHEKFRHHHTEKHEFTENNDKTRAEKQQAGKKRQYQPDETHDDHNDSRDKTDRPPRPQCFYISSVHPHTIARSTI